jgi:NADH-quinone oxidoreductase subunit C
MRNIEPILNDLQSEMRVEYSVEGNMNCLKVSRDDYIAVARYLRKRGFRRLLTVSAVDWIERGTLEAYFLVHKIDGNVYVKVAAEMRRENPLVPSLSELWPNAAMHERETWELFGVFFEGNRSLKPLFLEDWDEIPPFRKDFDWREYVKENNYLFKLRRSDDVRLKE